MHVFLIDTSMFSIPKKLVIDFLIPSFIHPLFIYSLMNLPESTVEDFLIAVLYV